MLSIVQSGQNSFMVVLITCKNEEDPIKSEGARVAKRLYVNFFRHSKALHRQCWDLAEIRINSSIYARPHYLQK